MVHTYTCRICGYSVEHEFSIKEPPPPAVIVLHTNKSDTDEKRRVWCSSTTLKRIWQTPRINMGIMPTTNDIDTFRFKNL